MASNEQAASAESARLNEAQKQFRLLLSQCLEFEKSSASVDEKKKQCKAIHDRAIELFNAWEKTIIDNDLLSSHKNERWIQIKAETSLTTLHHIVEFWKDIRILFEKLQLSPSSYPPTAFAAMQRLVEEHFPEEAASIRQKFHDNGLPTFGFDKPLPPLRGTEGRTNLEFGEYGITKATNLKSEDAKEILVNYANVKTPTLSASGAIKDQQVVETVKVAQNTPAQQGKSSYLKSIFTELAISPIKLMTSLLGGVLLIMLTYWLATNTSCQSLRRSTKETSDLHNMLSESAKAGAANRDASRNYLQMAINLEKDKQYQKALEAAIIATQLDPNNAEAIYRTAHIELYSLKPPQPSQAHTLLVGNKDKLNTDGKWLLGITYAWSSLFKESCETFNSVSLLPDFASIPYEIRIDALDSLLICSFMVSPASFFKTAQNIQIYVDKTLYDQSHGGKVSILRPVDDVQLMRFDLATLVYLPSIKFKLGVLSLTLFSNEKDHKESEILLSLSFIAEGFSSAIVKYGVDHVCDNMLPIRKICRMRERSRDINEKSKQYINALEKQIDKIKDGKWEVYGARGTFDISQPEREKLLDLQQQLRDCVTR